MIFVKSPFRRLIILITIIIWCRSVAIICVSSFTKLLILHILIFFPEKNKNQDQNILKKVKINVIDILKINSLQIL